MRKLVPSLTFAMAAFAATSAIAAAGLPTYTGELPSVLTHVSKSGLELHKKFQAADDLTGWVATDTQSGKQVILYTTQSGKTMMAGLMLDDAGTNLTAKYMEDHIPAPDYSVAYKEFMAADLVTVGSKKAKAEIVVAFDPNCGYCKIMHQLTQPAVAAGNLRVHYLPVGILSANSSSKAAALLQSKDVGADIDVLATGGEAKTSTDSELLEKVKKNTDLMRKHGFNGTPAVLYMGTSDGEKTVFVANGVPNVSEMFERLGVDGKLDELRQDKSLSRFVR